VNEERRGHGRETGPDGEDQDVGRLLRLAGMRAVPAADREHRVKAAVMREWGAAVRARRRKRAAAAAAILAAVAAAAILAVRGRWPDQGGNPARVVFAVVERLDDERASSGGAGASEPAGLAVGQSLWIGDELITGASVRLGARLPSGVSLRIDRASRVRLLAAHTVELAAGAVYVDSGPGAPAMVIDTPLGTVRDVGTQFEVSVEAETLRVRVRSGVVEVQRGRDLRTSRPGTELTFGSDGILTRAVPTFGPEWEWTTAVAPAFQAEGRSLNAFLEHLCREQGWTLAWADRRLGLDASSIIIHGSMDGLAPMDQLSVAVSTSGLGYRLEDGELTVSRPPSR